MPSSARRGYYSIIQYCPDLSRMEAANIGVVLFCPEPCFLGTRTSPDDQRIRRFFGAEGVDWDHVEFAKQAILSRLSDPAEFRTIRDLEHFAATRANEIQMTAPRPCKVFEPEAELDQLYEQLVAQRAEIGLGA